MSKILVEKDIVMRHISTVRPYIRNPRRNDKTVELLCKIIPRVGFNVPIVIDPEGVIVKGHARFFAAIKLGLEEVPCIITHADEDTIRVDRLTDNKISEFAEWIDDELEIELENMGIDLAEMGFFDLKVETGDKEINENIKEITEELLEEYSDEEKERVAEEIEEFSKMRAEGYWKAVCSNCGHVMFVKKETEK